MKKIVKIMLFCLLGIFAVSCGKIAVQTQQ